MVFSGYLIAALNKVAGERLSKFWHFVNGSLPVTGITLAQANAGYTVIPANVYTEQLIVHSFRLRVNSASVGTANVLLQTTESTPVVIATFANAQLTSGAILRPGDTGVTLGAGFCAKLNPGVGIQIKTSTTATGAFTLDLIPLEFSAR